MKYDKLMEYIFNALKEAGLSPKKAPCLIKDGKEAPSIVLSHYLIVQEQDDYMFEDILHGDIFYAPKKRIYEVSAQQLLYGVIIKIKMLNTFYMKEYTLIEGL